MTRVAVVTGAAGGMGRAITDQLLDDGFKVVGVDIDGPTLLMMGADRDGFIPEAVDLTDPQAVADLFDRLTTRFGGVDALVNNAGTCFMSDFPDIPAQELTRQMEINFHSAFHCCQGAVKGRITQTRRAFRIGCHANIPNRCHGCVLSRCDAGIRKAGGKALISGDRKQVFRVDDGIPVLLADEAIATAQITDFPAK